MKVNRYVTTSSIAMPMMISGSTKVMSIMKFAPVASRPRQRSRPIAKDTPSGTVWHR